MRRLRVFLVTVAIAAFGLIGFAQPASAGTCPIDRLITTGSCW
ncbi:MAG: hypothetical protein ABR505_02365 [Actinomycetota bacterium]